MKKTLLTCALLGVLASSALAQGTINPLNGPLAGTKIKVDLNGDGVGDRNVAATDGVTFSIYFGAAGSDTTPTLAGTMSIGTSAGSLSGLATLFQVAGAAEGSTVPMRITAANADRTWIGDTGIRQVTLGPSGGPATVIWSSTASDKTFSPMVLQVVPEPSTIALGVLGFGSLLLFRRRK